MARLREEGERQSEAPYMSLRGGYAPLRLTKKLTTNCILFYSPRVKGL